MPAMTAVYFVNVLSLLIIRIPRVPGANINEVPNSEKFSHSAGGPQLELRWGPGRAKRARARHTYTKTRKTAKSHLFSELGEMLGNTDKYKKTPTHMSDQKNRSIIKKNPKRSIIVLVHHYSGPCYFWSIFFQKTVYFRGFPPTSHCWYVIMHERQVYCCCNHNV